MALSRTFCEGTLDESADIMVTPGFTIGTAANGTIGLSPSNSWEEKVSDRLESETETVFQAIVDGVIYLAFTELDQK